MSEFPYPGLRPFRRDEKDIFFGREEQVDELLDTLDSSRFLAVIGSSGCGKSSLVRAGVLPALATGFLASAGVRWSTATLHPGTHPMRNLAEALLEPEVLGAERQVEQVGYAGSVAFLLATLRRGPLGLVEALAETPLPKNANLLLLVDQFEEIFRYHKQTDPDEVEAFVSLLLVSAKHPDIRVYVVVTMRSDFLGDCARVEGLPEAINHSQYLVPRLNRNQRQAAITEPAEVFGYEVEPILVNQILNDMGTDPDQLPLMQHALMWLWIRANRQDRKTLCLSDYRAMGGLEQALSRHADQAFGELEPSGQVLAETLFRRLTERSPGNRDIRRPAKLGEIAMISEASPEQVATVVEVFRRPDRSFLTPPAGVPLATESVIEISHESLIRQWQQLNEWVEDEAASAESYRRLEQTARLWAEGKAALWHTPDLDIALRWREQQQPNAEWAARYGGNFQLAIKFLDTSEHEWQAEQTSLRRQETRRWRIRLTLVTVFAAIVMVVAIVHWFQDQQIKAQNQWFRVSLSHWLSTEALNSFKQHPLRNLLLAVQAVAITGKETLPQAEEALREILRQTGGTPLHGHRDTVRSVAFDPQRQRVATASEDGTVRLWSLADLQAPPKVLHEQEGAMTSVAFDSRDQRLAAGSNDGTVRMWDLANPETSATVFEGQEDEVTSVAFDPRDRWLAAGSNDGTVWIRNLTDPQANPTVLDLTGDLFGVPVSSVAFDPRGRWLAVAGFDGIVRLWKLTDVEADPQLLSGHAGEVTSIAFDRDGQRLATASIDGSVRLWRLTRLEAEPIVLLEGVGAESSEGEEATSPVLAVAFDPRDQWLVIGTQDSMIRGWRLDDLEAEPVVLYGHEGSVNAIAFDRDGQWLVTTGSDATVRVWEWDKLPVEPRVLPGHTSMAFPARPVSSVAFDSQGRWLASGSEDKLVRLWNLAELQETPRVLSGHEGGIWSLAFDPRGRWLATASGDQTVRLWDLTTPQAPATILGGHEGGVWSVSFDQQGRRLATGGADGTVRLWILADEPGQTTPRGEVLGRHGDSAVLVAVFDPQGRWLASGGGDRTVRLWHLTNDLQVKPPRILRGHDDIIRTIAFDPLGRWLATGSSDNTVRLWDLSDFTARPRVLGHEDWVRSVAFGPQGKQLATGSFDGTLRLWNLADPEEAPTVLRGHEGSVGSIAFDPQRRWLATGGDDGRIRLWRLELDELVELACRIAGRNLTAEERRLFGLDKPNYARQFTIFLSFSSSVSYDRLSVGPSCKPPD